VLKDAFGLPLRQDSWGGHHKSAEVPVLALMTIVVVQPRNWLAEKDSPGGAKGGFELSVPSRENLDEPRDCLWGVAGRN
jgi:hypothetical protein